MKFIRLKLLLLSFLFVFSPLAFVSANDDIDTSNISPSVSSNLSGGQMSAFKGSAGLSYSMSAENVVANVIQIALSLLGVIFLILMIYSGYQWMMAGGNQETVKTAQGRIKNAIIGLAIIAMAYAITAFVFRALPGGGTVNQDDGSTEGGNMGP